MYTVNKMKRKTGSDTDPIYGVYDIKHKKVVQEHLTLKSAQRLAELRNKSLIRGGKGRC